MGIYLPNMEMPTSCYKCNMRRRDGMYLVCPIAHERFSIADINILEYRLDNCPLLPVPPHGRLIDADELFKEMENNGWYDNADRDIAEDLVLDAPAIIPAEPCKEKGE